MYMERTGKIAVGKEDNVNCISWTYSCWAPSNLHLQLRKSHLHGSKNNFPVGCSAFILHFFCTLQFLSKTFSLLTNQSYFQFWFQRACEFQLFPDPEYQASGQGKIHLPFTREHKMFSLKEWREQSRTHGQHCLSRAMRAPAGCLPWEASGAWAEGWIHRRTGALYSEN